MSRTLTLALSKNDNSPLVSPLALDTRGSAVAAKSMNKTTIGIEQVIILF